MSIKSDQRRQKKKKDRERKIRRDINIRRNNLPAPKYRLDLFLNDEWRMGVLSFRTWEAVLKHQEDTEKSRVAGDDITEGRIIEIGTGMIKMTIAPSKPIKGALPDKLAEHPESAEKAVIDNLKELPNNLKV